MLIEGTATIHADKTASPTSDEGALVLAHKALDERAWETIFDAYYERLTTFLRYRIGNASAAEDLASQVFVEAVAGIERYSYRGTPLGAWLFRIARNVSSDYLRRETRNANAAADVAFDAEHPEPAKFALDEGRLMLTMDQLTPDQRQVVVLRFFSDLSIEETAKVMGKSQGAVKALQHRGLEHMRRILAANSSSAQGD